jgi:hypothetical protein
MNGRATARVTTAPRSTPRTASRAATPRPDLKLVPAVTPTRPRRRAVAALRHPKAAFVLLVVGLLVATTLGLLILNTAIAVDSLKATHMRAENAQRAQQVQHLQQQVVTGSASAEIARAATAAGLVPAGPAAYLVIAPDGSSVVRGTAEPAGSAGAQGGN